MEDCMEHDKKKNVNQNRDREMGNESTRQPNEPFEGGKKNIGQEESGSSKRPGDRNLDTERGVGDIKDRDSEKLNDI
jgi:hypothetical protein